MDQIKWIYYVEKPLEGAVDQWQTIVRATTPEGAGEVVRIILSQFDDSITIIRIRALRQL